MNDGLILGIDVSRNRSGGAVAHIKGILSESDPRRAGIKTVHLWGYPQLIDSIPDQPWLIKHSPADLSRNLAIQLKWQASTLTKEARRYGCDILFSTDASTLCRFVPLVVMSQDMLSFEPQIMATYGITPARLRLELLLHVQNWAFRRAAGVVFLTKYAADAVINHTGSLKRVAYIAHGVDKMFSNVPLRLKGDVAADGPIRCLYVSNAEIYKNHPTVVAAVAKVRKAGCDLRLTLVGGGVGRGRARLVEAIATWDPRREFVESHDFVKHSSMPRFLAEADIFVFASTCENLPVTLLEAMAAGRPIVCSNRGPMPEVLQDGGVYFDPEFPEDLAAALTRVINNNDLRRRIALRARELSAIYTWKICGEKTWEFLVQTHRGGGVSSRHA